MSLFCLRLPSGLLRRYVRSIEGDLSEETREGGSSAGQGIDSTWLTIYLAYVIVCLPLLVLTRNNRSAPYSTKACHSSRALTVLHLSGTVVVFQDLPLPSLRRFSSLSYCHWMLLFYTAWDDTRSGCVFIVRASTVDCSSQAERRALLWSAMNQVSA